MPCDGIILKSNSWVEFTSHVSRIPSHVEKFNALTSAGFRPKDESVAPDLEASITVCQQPEYNRLDRKKLVDLGIDPDILEAASITVPSKLHFRIGGINAGIT